MFDIKMRARYIAHSGGRFLKGARREAALMLTGAFVFLLTGTGLILSGENFLFRYFPFPLYVNAALCLTGAIFLAFFYFAARLYFSALVFYIGDRAFLLPADFMKFSSVMKYTACLLTVLLLKSLWRILFFAPSAVISFLIIRTLEVHGSISAYTLSGLLVTLVLLWLTGLCFYTLVRGRYILCELLFIRNPRQSIREIIKGSVRASQKGPFALTLLALRRGLCFTVLGRCVWSLLLQDVFSEKKYYKRLGLSESGTYQSIPRAL